MSIKMSGFLLKITGISKATNSIGQKRRKFMVVYTIAALVYGVYVNVVDIYHNLHNLDHCIFLASNTLNIILAMFKLSVLHFYKTEFSDIIVYAQKHFWHIDYNDDEKILFAECRNFCKLWTVFILLVTESSLSFYAIVPISANIGNNGSERLLPFKMWVNLPLTVTPYYEIMFAIEVLQISIHVDFKLMVVFSCAPSSFEKFKLLATLYLSLPEYFAHIIFFTYICHGLVEESTNISIASYSGWWVCLPMSKTGKKIRKDMKMMMMKAMRPCQLTAGGFFPVNLETSTALCVVNLHESFNNAIKDQIGDQKSDTRLSYYAIISDTKLKSCVQQHRVLIEYRRKLENIFMAIVLGRVISCYDVCLVGFQLFLVNMVGDIF
ncbi:uncharacterized protein LOC100745292 [Bombus impatiens]|uniref:Odorant receptor n=1 Tax=Bombus impatiens TaxID=132113 RepID=A0A6P8KYZ9_BOMIM|nr:uncharacterized protein LOC100745292 [Bombus impatiens]